MKNKPAKYLVWSLVVLLALPASSAIPVPLRPGTSITVDCVSGNILTRRSTSPTNLPNVTVRLDAALDTSGTVLTLTLRNTSASTTDAALYALDLGLPTRFVNMTRLEASFAAFPLGARWEGPTDLTLPTTATGSCTFAAREIIATGLDAYLKTADPLSSGFLGSGQSGRITVKLARTTDAPVRILLLNPVAYLLAPDPAAPDKRMQIALTSILRPN